MLRFAYPAASTLPKLTEEDHVSYLARFLIDVFLSAIPIMSVEFNKTMFLMNLSHMYPRHQTCLMSIYALLEAMADMETLISMAVRLLSLGKNDAKH